MSASAALRRHHELATARAELDQALAEAIPIRKRTLELANDPSPDAQLEKESLVRDAADALDRARLVGDVLVGAFFSESKKKARATERDRRWDLVQRWLDGDADAEAELRSMQADVLGRLPVFHWMLEFPEVFWGGRADPLAGWETDGEAYFDAFVGNPPFAGKNGITETGGPGYLDWLQAMHVGAHGNADLSAHFFLRAADLLREHGTFGLLTTNTSSHGDTRATGLQRLVVDEGVVLYDATRSMKWPVPGAAVMVAVVHGARGSCADGVSLRLDGKAVEAINSRLRPTPERPDPVKLPENAGCSFVGNYVLGTGFTLSPEERDELLARDTLNDSHIFPYLGGQEVDSSPTQSHSRYVIGFGEMSLEEAAAWPDLLSIVRERVKPQRDQLKNNTDGRDYKNRWWQFAKLRAGMDTALGPLTRCLVTARVTKHLCFSFQPTNRIFNEKLYVFPLPSATAFAILQSRVHAGWTWLLSSTMKGDLNYSATDCFETFPFPQADPRAEISGLETIGRRVYEARADYMVDTDQGLTQTYNRLKDPDCHEERIEELRRLHEEMDRAVLRAYHECTGDNAWVALEVPPYSASRSNRSDVESHGEQLQFFHDLVIDGLFVLNAERAGISGEAT